MERVHNIIKRFAKVFEGAANTLPKPFDAPPIELQFRPDAIPQSVPEPRWSFANGKTVKKWAQDGLANGSLELSTSKWASRAHIVLKLPSEMTKMTLMSKIANFELLGITVW